MTAQSDPASLISFPLVLTTESSLQRQKGPVHWKGVRGEMQPTQQEGLPTQSSANWSLAS